MNDERPRRAARPGTRTVAAAGDVPFAPELPDVPPDKLDCRTNGCKPASEAEGIVQIAERTGAGQPPPPPLAHEPRILERFLDDLRLAGVAGEERLAQLTYLALTSRLLEWGKPTNRPVSIIAKGSTSTGKSYTTQSVLRFFPPDSYLDLGSMSKRYLLYADDTLSHRFLVVPEWSAMANDDELVTALRTLLSEGRLIHGTVEGDSKKAARRIEKDGPTGLVITTTAARVDRELETRCLSVITDDSPEQTRRVFATLAALEDEDESPVHVASWHQLQTWLAEDGETRTHVPYAQSIAELMPATATRLRRDFVSLLCLIRAHAVLHQANRDRDQRGRIVATVADYAAVRDLISELVAESAGASVSPAIRETVEAVRDLLEDEGEYVAMRPVMDRLNVGRSAAYDRISRALAGGYLANIARKDERGYKLALGAPLPGEEGFLPEPAALSVRPSSNTQPDNVSPAAMRDSDALSGRPASPAKPRRTARNAG